MILVTGAKGVVGTPLCKELGKRELPYLAVSRSSNNESLQWDLNQPSSGEELALMSDIDTLIHCAPIWLLPQHIAALAHAKLTRVIAFSSTSVVSKTNSSNAAEQKLVRLLSEAEKSLAEQCSRFEIKLTILRPSLIYGYGRDQNVSHIARFIKKWRFMLLVGKASGKRQPVHADDLVWASLRVLNEEKTYGQVYNLAGKEILTYRAMVQRIFSALKQQPWIISLPLTPFRWALSMASKLGSFAYTPDMADRMNQDLSYDIVAAKIDFDYQPQAFLEDPQRDLVNLI